MMMRTAPMASVSNRNELSLKTLRMGGEWDESQLTHTDLSTVPVSYPGGGQKCGDTDHITFDNSGSALLNITSVY
jgi:hypothetical protein